LWIEIVLWLSDYLVIYNVGNFHLSQQLSYRLYFQWQQSMPKKREKSLRVAGIFWKQKISSSCYCGQFCHHVRNQGSSRVRTPLIDYLLQVGRVYPKVHHQTYTGVPWRYHMVYPTYPGYGRWRTPGSPSKRPLDTPLFSIKTARKGKSLWLRKMFQKNISHYFLNYVKQKLTWTFCNYALTFSSHLADRWTKKIFFLSKNEWLWHMNPGEYRACFSLFIPILSINLSHYIFWWIFYDVRWMKLWKKWEMYAQMI